MTQSRMLAHSGWPFDAHRRREDHGFFGPDSPTWKVWTSPTALIGFQRSVVVESFDPFLAAAVNDANGVRYDAKGRLDSTLTYFTIVAVGDSRAAIEASELLMKVHTRATGIEPITGRRYSANNPDSQLWIHVTGWHSVLYCYERLGPGRLSAADEARYWADCVTAAQLQTCDPAGVPSNRAEVRDYFDAVRPRLCASEGSRSLMHHLLFPPAVPGDPLLRPAAHAMARATIATVPAWMRVLGGFDQSRAADALAISAGRAAMRVATPLPARLRLVDRVSPSIRPVWQNALRGAPPLRDETVTPAQARERFGAIPARPDRRAVAR